MRNLLRITVFLILAVSPLTALSQEAESVVMSKVIGGKAKFGQVVIEKDTVVKVAQWFVEGTSHVVADTTSYIKYRTGPKTVVHLTVTCRERFVWDRCFTLHTGEVYNVHFDYKHRKVYLTGWPNGNLNPPVTFETLAANIIYEEK